MNDIITICAEVAKNIQCTKKGSCGSFAILATHELFANGYTDFKIVFGFVKDPLCPPRVVHQHVWLEMADGTIVDPTLEQFAKPANHYPSKKTKKYTPQQFMSNPFFKISLPATIAMLNSNMKR